MTGFTLNVRGSGQLNYDVRHENLIDKVTQPLDERRNIHVVNPNFFWRNPATKHLRVITRTKFYGPVFINATKIPRLSCHFPTDTPVVRETVNQNNPWPWKPLLCSSSRHLGWSHDQIPRSDWSTSCHVIIYCRLATAPTSILYYFS